VPIYDLHFPRDYNALPDVQARILAELARA
jgi:hypothetical protein